MNANLDSRLIARLMQSSIKLTKAGAQPTSSPKAGICREECYKDRNMDTCIATLSEVPERAEEEARSNLAQTTDKLRDVEDEYKYIEFDQDERGLIVRFDTLVSDTCPDCGSESLISTSSDNAKGVLTNISAKFDSSCDVHTFVHFYEGDGTQGMRSSLFDDNFKLGKSNKVPSEYSDGGGDNILVDEDKYEHADDSGDIENDRKNEYDNDDLDAAAEHDGEIVSDDTLGDNGDDEADHRCCRWFRLAAFRKKRKRSPGDSCLPHEALANLKHATDGDDNIKLHDDFPDDNGDADAGNVADDDDTLMGDNLGDNGDGDVDIVSDDDDTVKDDNLDDNSGGDDDIVANDDTVKDDNLDDNGDGDDDNAADDGDSVNDDNLGDNRDDDANNFAATNNTVKDGNLCDNGGGDDGNVTGDDDDTVKYDNLGDNGDGDDGNAIDDGDTVKDNILSDNGGGNDNNADDDGDTVYDDNLGDNGNVEADHGCCSWPWFAMFRKKRKRPPRVSHSPREVRTALKRGADNTSDLETKKDGNRISRFSRIMQRLNLRKGPKDTLKT